MGLEALHIVPSAFVSVDAQKGIVYSEFLSGSLPDGKHAAVVGIQTIVQVIAVIFGAFLTFLIILPTVQRFNISRQLSVLLYGKHFNFSSLLIDYISTKATIEFLSVYKSILKSYNTVKMQRKAVKQKCLKNN